MALEEFQSGRTAVHPLLVLQMDPLRPGQEPPVRQGLPQRGLQPFPLLFGGRKAGRHAVAHAGAERSGRLRSRHSVQMPALRQLRRGLQGLPLRHGAAGGAAGVPADAERAGQGPGRIPEAHRQPAGSRQLRRTAADRPGHVVRRAGAEGTGGRRRSPGAGAVPRRMPLLVRPHPPLGGAGGGEGAQEGRSRLRHRPGGGLLHRQGLRHGLPRRLREGGRSQP